MKYEILDVTWCFNVFSSSPLMPFSAKHQNKEERIWWGEERRKRSWVKMKLQDMYISLPDSQNYMQNVMIINWFFSQSVFGSLKNGNIMTCIIIIFFFWCLNSRILKQLTNDDDGKSWKMICRKKIRSDILFTSNTSNTKSRFMAMMMRVERSCRNTKKYDFHP